MNLLIICIFILNILLILQVIYYFKEFKSNSKKIKKLVLFIVFGFMLLPIKTFALETLFIGNGTVLNRCTSNICSYDAAGTTNYRATLDNYNFTIDETYTFSLYFNATTSMASPTLTDCGLNINGSYVSPQSRNSGRTTYECNANLTRCDSAYVSSIVWTATSSLSNVPVFIQCDMTPQAARYTYTQFSYSVNGSNGSVINAIDQANNNLINTQNYNANQNNANRDSNTDRQINNQNSLFSGLNNTLNNIKQFIGDKIDSVGTGISNVITGLTTGFGNVVSAVGNIVTPIVDAVGNVGSSIINTGQSIISAFGNIVSPIVNSIGNGINNVINGVKSFFFKCDKQEYILNINDSAIEGYGLNPQGDLNPNSDFGVSNYYEFSSGDVFILQSNTTINYYAFCLYDDDKNIVSCEAYQNRDNITLHPNFDGYIRTSLYKYTNTTLKFTTCKNRLFSLFDSFVDFVHNLFDNTIGNVWNKLNEITTIQDTPVTDLILMPLSLIEALHTAITTNSCSGYTIPFDFTGGNNTLTLPCINLQNYLGSTLWSAIDLILMGLMIYSIGQMVVSFFESWSSLHDTFDYLYNVGPNNKG